jgi:hypothetical protein
VGLGSSTQTIAIVVKDTGSGQTYTQILSQFAICHAVQLDHVPKADTGISAIPDDRTLKFAEAALLALPPTKNETFLKKFDHRNALTRRVNLEFLFEVRSYLKVECFARG